MIVSFSSSTHNKSKTQDTKAQRPLPSLDHTNTPIPNHIPKNNQAEATFSNMPDDSVHYGYDENHHTPMIPTQKDEGYPQRHTDDDKMIEDVPTIDKESKRTLEDTKQKVEDIKPKEKGWRPEK